MQNILSRKGYQYVFFVVDHAPKLFWNFPMATRESNHIQQYSRAVISETLPSRGTVNKNFN